MNKERREKINRVIDHLDILYRDVDSILDDEQYCLDNMPENLSSSENYVKMEDSVDCLESALASLDEAKDSLRDAC